MLSINRKSLQNALKVLVKVSDSKSVNPYAAMIRIRAQDLVCQLTATDLRQELTASLALDIESEIDVLRDFLAHLGDVERALSLGTDEMDEIDL